MNSFVASNEVCCCGSTFFLSIPLAKWCRVCAGRSIKGIWEYGESCHVVFLGLGLALLCFLDQTCMIHQLRGSFNVLNKRG